MNRLVKNMLVILSATMISACSTLYDEKEKQKTATVSVSLQGQKPFCVVTEYWKLDDKIYSFSAKEGEKKICTSSAATRKLKNETALERHLYFGSSVSIGNKDFEKLELAFKRHETGPLIRVEFRLNEKFEPNASNQYVVINPMINESGVDLMRTEYTFSKKKAFTEMKSILIESKTTD